VLSTSSDLFEETVVGAAEAIAAAKKTGRFDHDARIEGLQAVDRHTIRIKLVRPDYDCSWRSRASRRRPSPAKWSRPSRPRQPRHGDPVARGHTC